MLGEVCVDSGQLTITDPCYVGNDNSNGTLTFTTAFGDGVFPVLCQRDKHSGGILTVLIDVDPFLPEQNDDL